MEFGHNITQKHNAFAAELQGGMRERQKEHFPPGVHVALNDSDEVACGSFARPGRKSSLELQYDGFSALTWGVHASTSCLSLRGRTPSFATPSFGGTDGSEWKRSSLCTATDECVTGVRLARSDSPNFGPPTVDTASFLLAYDKDTKQIQNSFTASEDVARNFSVNSLGDGSSFEAGSYSCGSWSEDANRGSWNEEVDDSPGLYILTERVQVRAEVGLESTPIRSLPKDSAVKVTEVVRQKDGRTRAHIDKPNGWITIHRSTDNMRWAMKKPDARRRSLPALLSLIPGRLRGTPAQPTKEG